MKTQKEKLQATVTSALGVVAGLFLLSPPQALQAVAAIGLAAASLASRASSTRIATSAARSWRR